MKKQRIAIVSAGAVGAYVGAHMARAGLEPVLIDGWPAHVEQMRAHGLSITGTTPSEAFTTPVRALHVCDVPQLMREEPFDIAFICPKSYDTEWAAMLIRPYLAADGCAVSLQNCMNDERLGGVVGWGRTLGCIASKIMVELFEPGHVHRGVAKGGRDYTVFRVGEAHGRITARAQLIAQLLESADSAKASANLWGERWSKLAANCMENGMSAATGMLGNDVMRSEAHRRILIRLAGEAVRIGRRRCRSAGGARRNPAGAVEKALRYPGRLDGAGYGQGPAHRNRIHERFRGANRQVDRHAGAAQSGVDRTGAQGRTRATQGRPAQYREPAGMIA